LTRDRELTLLAGGGRLASDMALNIVSNAAISAGNGMPATFPTIALYSCASYKTELSMRMLSIVSGVDMELMRMGQLDSSNWKQLANASETLRRGDIRIMHRQMIEPNQLTAFCHEIETADLIIIDSIDFNDGLVADEDIMKFCDGLRQRAAYLACPVLLTMPSSPESVEKITAKALRCHSGALFGKVDTVIGIDSENTIATLHLLKDELIPFQSANIRYDHNCMRFSEATTPGD